MHCYAGSKNAAKALIAAEYNGVKIACPAFEMGVTNKTAAFLKLNPLGKARRRCSGVSAARARLTRLRRCRCWRRPREASSRAMPLRATSRASAAAACWAPRRRRWCVPSRGEPLPAGRAAAVA